jgi:hypothetical protein
LTSSLNCVPNSNRLRMLADPSALLPLMGRAEPSNAAVSEASSTRVGIPLGKNIYERVFRNLRPKCSIASRLALMHDVASFETQTHDRGSRGEMTPRNPFRPAD